MILYARTDVKDFTYCNIASSAELLSCLLDRRQLSEADVKSDETEWRREGRFPGRTAIQWWAAVKWWIRAKTWIRVAASHGNVRQQIDSWLQCVANIDRYFWSLTVDYMKFATIANDTRTGFWHWLPAPVNQCQKLASLPYDLGQCTCSYSPCPLYKCMVCSKDICKFSTPREKCHTVRHKQRFTAFNW